MDRHRRAFALMIAIVTVAAVFAAAVSISVIVRASVVESGALSRAIEQEFAARTAAARVIAGVVGEGVGARGEVAPSGPEPDGKAPTLDTDELPEMPEFMREFLEGMLEDEAQDGEASEPEPAPRPTSQRNASRYLTARGLPTRPVSVQVGDATFRVRMTDAVSRVSLNAAEDEELQRLFLAAGASPGLARTLAAELIDYRDADDFLTPFGAESDAYTRRGMTIRNAPLTVTDELLFLPSMPPELLDAVRPLATTGGNGRLHAPTVPEAVLRCLPGMTPEAAAQIIALRESGRLDADSLRGALPLFAGDLFARFQFQPSPILRVEVRREDAPGPLYEGLAVVSPSAGVQWVRFRMP